MLAAKTFNNLDWFAYVMLLGLGAALIAQASADNPLKHMQVALCDGPTFVLSYSGPIVEFSGELCYGFAGYNETCLRPKLEWLTPATQIELIAPGQVPEELLKGYTLLVRFPALSETQYRYPVTADNSSCKR